MNNVDIKSIGEIFDSLVTTDIKCFLAQDRIRDPNLSQEEQLKAAHLAQEMNALRNKLIRKIDERLGDSELSPSAKSYD